MSNTTQLLFVLFLLSVLFNTLYLIFLYLKLHRFRPYENRPDSALPFVSIVVCTRNGIETLPALLDALLNQDYPEYEIVIVDDESDDATQQFLHKTARAHAIVRIFRLNHSLPGKKQALLYGVQKAKGPWVAVTDDDCLPSSQWLSLMMYVMKEKDDFILGYSPYRVQKGMLNKWIRFETVRTAVQYLGWAIAGSPYMGVGRNMMYKRSWIKGDTSFLKTHIPSGDDDLLVAALAHGENTSICLHPESFVYSKPKSTWYEWLKQKSRHVSTSVFYRGWQRIMLGVYGLTQVLLLAGIPLIFTSFGTAVILAYFLRYILLYLFGKSVYQRLDGQDLLVWAPVLDLGLSFLYLVLIPFTFIRSRGGW